MDALPEYRADPGWRRLVWSIKWGMRLLVVSLPTLVLATALSSAAFDVVWYPFISAFMVIFLVSFVSGLDAMWREFRYRLPGPNDFHEWNNTAWSAGWRAAWRRGPESE